MRLIEILFYLLKCNSKTTIKQLAERFNVSPKTIQRDLDKLSVLGIPIISCRGISGGIELDRNYIIAKYVLTENDYEDLILSLYISENIASHLKKSDLIEKFKLVNHNRCDQILSNLERRFIIDLDEQQAISEKEVCKIINSCLEDKIFVKLELKEMSIEVVPISYVLKKEGIYLYCYAKTYKLISMDHIYQASKSSHCYDGVFIQYKENKDNLKLL